MAEVGIEAGWRIVERPGLRRFSDGRRVVMALNVLEAVCRGLERGGMQVQDQDWGPWRPVRVGE